MADTQAIKDRLDIVQVIGEYVQLKRAGTNWKGRCPFHNEKSPSFMVHPERQFYHCFGCGKGGDIFTFIQELEGLEFPEALKLLADRAGVKLTNDFQSEVNKSQKNRLLEINAAAANFFHNFLLQIPAAKGAREYLERRTLKSETIENWKVGFITDQWDLLTQYLLKKGFAIDDLVASGLTIKKENASVGRGFYDRFRGRVMFPIWDVHSNVVGFTGRILIETEHSGGKYVNTPQTLIYDKSRVIYGLDKAKTEIKARDLVVVVEGQMDVIACHQAGMKNVVASSGTAFTPEQIRLLKRYTNNIAMAFDADNAGQEAMKRGIDAALAEGMNVRVIRIPEGAGKDADECIKKDKNTWFKAVENAMEIMTWYFTGILSKYDLTVPREKQLAASTLIAEIAKITYPVERDDWLHRLGEKLNIDMNILRDELRKAMSGKQLVAGSAHISPHSQSKSIVGAANSKTPTTRLHVLTEGFWSLIVKYFDLYGSIRDKLKSDYFVGTDFGTLYDLAETQYNKNNQINLDELRQSSIGAPYDVDILSLRAEKDFSQLNVEEARKEMANLLQNIAEEWKKGKRKELQNAIAQAARAGEHDQEVLLLTKLQEI